MPIGLVFQIDTASCLTNTAITDCTEILPANGVIQTQAHDFIMTKLNAQGVVHVKAKQLVVAGMFDIATGLYSMFKLMQLVAVNPVVHISSIVGE